jgi:hypothetical protein
LPSPDINLWPKADEMLAAADSVIAARRAAEQITPIAERCAAAGRAEAVRLERLVNPVEI